MVHITVVCFSWIHAYDEVYKHLMLPNKVSFN